VVQNGTRQKGLTVRQRRVIGYLLECGSVKDAALAAEVGRTTVNRWLALPEFRAGLAEAQGHVLSLVSAKVAGLLTQALDLVGEAMAGDLAPSAAGRLRLYAAGMILRHAAQLMEYAGLEDRVKQLEAILGDQSAA